MAERRLDEPVAVQVRFSADGRVRPTAFLWRGQRHALVSWGRQWTAESDDGAWRCFLVQTVNGDAAELRWNQRTHQWWLVRIWRREALT